MMRTHLRVLTALVNIWLAVIGLLALAPRNRRHPAVRCDGTRPCIAQFG